MTHKNSNSPPKGAKPLGRDGDRITEQVQAAITKAMEELGYKEFQAVCVIIKPMNDANHDEGCDTYWISTATDNFWTADILEDTAKYLKKKGAN